MFMRMASLGVVAIVLLAGGGCATNPGSPPPSLAASVARADAAYRNLPASLSAYNLAVREVCAAMEVENPPQCTANLQRLGVAFDGPNIGLLLRHVEVAAPNGTGAGVPLVVGYETKKARLYPPEGLFVEATATYDRVAGRPRFSIL